MKLNNWARLVSVSAFATALMAHVALAETAEGAKPGLPQLDTSLYPEQLFWLAVTFTALYLLMAYVALPGIQRVQGRRHTVIAEEIQNAESATTASNQMISDYERALSDARAKAQSSIDAVKVETAREIAQKLAEQQQSLQKRIRDSEINVTNARDSALQNVAESTELLARSIDDALIRRRA